MSLNIYASGRAFVANGYDTLTVQCFYSTISAKFFTALTLGQKFQTMLQILVPSLFVGQEFASVYRAFTARSISVLGIYRGVSEVNKATFPYVYVSPKAGSKLSSNDRLFVFCNPFLLDTVLEEFRKKYMTSMQSVQGTPMRATTTGSNGEVKTWISVQSARKFSSPEKGKGGTRNDWY